MITVVLIWCLILFIFVVFGFSITKVIARVSGQIKEESLLSVDEYFFMGFLTLAAIAGFLSIWIPVGSKVLLFFIFLSLLIFLIYLSEFKIIIKTICREIVLLKRAEIIFIALFLLFLLIIVVQRITLWDAGLYHVQSIQWIQKYSVVPGLGNIHGRLASNSMFFVVSALFTFKLNEILVFPLNGICYFVLAIKLMVLIRNSIRSGNVWKSVLYGLILVVSLTIMITSLNSTSPDIICGILIIYAFILLINSTERESQFSYIRFILLNLIVFSCIAFKISSIFLILILFISFKKEYLNRFLIMFGVGIFILSPFIIRNYYLSGYLIFPFPAIDIFSVDWKVPLEKAIQEKEWIVSWAKIQGLPYQEVINLKISQWILPWFKLLSFNSKVLVITNLLSIFLLIIMVLKKDLIFIRIQLIIIINLIFWFLMAPAPRFAYGFLIFGFSITIAYLIKLNEQRALSSINKYFKLVLSCLVFMIFCSRIAYSVNIIKTPSLLVISAPFDKIETKEFNTTFLYKVPINDDRCYNSQIPCVPYPLTDVVLRGIDLKDGFKVINAGH